MGVRFNLQVFHPRLLSRLLLLIVNHGGVQGFRALA